MSYVEGEHSKSCSIAPASSLNLAQWFLWKNATLLNPFTHNDAVEAQAYDSLNRRLAVASHSGQIQMFNVDKASEMS